MDTIVKYHFDREMVSFVKSLEFKNGMFGYDKNDVYSKIKDLLVKARDVCEELVSEECRKFEEIRAGLLDLADDPEALRAYLHDWDMGLPLPDRLTDESGLEDPAEEEMETDLDPGDAEEPAPTGGETPSQGDDALLDEIAALRARLKELEDRQELLDRAHDIVSEARLEREAIIRQAQTKAEEELFLYRAKRRDEERAYLAQIEAMEARKADLESDSARYRSYVMEGRALFDQLQAYASQIDQVRSEDFMPEKDKKDLDFTDLDPPVLSLDPAMPCTEESMPLCEMAEESPEAIFPDLDVPPSQPELENEPDEEEGEACQPPLKVDEH